MSLLCAKMLFTFHWQHEKHFANFFFGSRLISISPCLSNNLKKKWTEKENNYLRVLSYEHTPASFYGNTR